MNPEPAALPLALFATIHAALALVTPAAVLRIVWPGNERRQRAARGLWTAAWLAYLGHVAVALLAVHQGSHAAAYAHTARRTAEVFGVETGAGLYVNYLFTLAWTADVALWWRRGTAYRAAAPRWAAAFEAGLLFMVVNGAVVFAAGTARLLGIAVSAAIVAAWLARARAPGGRIGAESRARPPGRRR